MIPVVRAAAYDCSVSCPGGKTVGGLDWVTGCVNKDTLLSPTWCDEKYDTDNVGTCPNDCGPINWPVGVCEVVTKTMTVSPYTTTKNCEIKPATDVVPCCDDTKPAACQGGCGNAGCSIGNCVNNKCVNVNCPSDPDCVCDAAPPTPTCTVSISGDNSVEAGSVVRSYSPACRH